MPDKATTKRFEVLLSEYLDGDLAKEAAREFASLLEAEPKFTTLLVEQLGMDARLAQFETKDGAPEKFLNRVMGTVEAEADGGEFVGRVLERAEAENPSNVVTAEFRSRRSWSWVAAAVAVALMVGLFLKHSWAPAGVAQVAELQNCRWRQPDSRFESGDFIAVGQRIEISSGSAELIFHSGARLEIVGPAIFEPRSDNGGFLTMGEVHIVAETPGSQGFTIETPTSKFIDISTAFTAAVSPDGLSRLDVIDGEVDVVLDGGKPERFQRGQTLFVEPGEQRILARIEAGEGTSGFLFPTIEPPSSDDYADQASGHASIRVARGTLRSGNSGSGPAAVLLDGAGQAKPDAPSQSAFFKTGTGGQFLLDLGQAISISKIQSYSWHQHGKIEEHRERARQRFTLYGFSGDKLPNSDLPLDEAGWTRIARVNSDEFFRVNERLDRPAQQASSIYAAEGELGRFRYLLWDVKTSSFYGEFDVFGKP